MINMIDASKIIDKYNNQPHVRGTVDCNLLVLELFDRPKFQIFKGRYSTLTGAVRVARKEFGVSSVKDLMETETEHYEKINPNFQQPLDIVVFHGRHDVYISLGNNWFGVNSNDTFSVVPKTGYNEDDYVIYRRK